MSDYTPRDMSGALFANDKGENPKRPDCKGSCVVAGHLYDVAGWWETTKDGKPYLSLQFTEPHERKAAQPAEPRPAPNFPPPAEAADDKDGIPF